MMYSRCLMGNKSDDEEGDNVSNRDTLRRPSAGC